MLRVLQAKKHGNTRVVSTDPCWFAPGQSNLSRDRERLRNCVMILVLQGTAVCYDRVAVDSPQVLHEFFGRLSESMH